MSGGPLAGSVVIGLEVHVQLGTRTKLFCGCAAAYGRTPNASVCETCLGLPGTLPVLNRAAVDLAVRAALGLGFTVHDVSLFARKHYFYPDLPRGFQITQHQRPLATGGALTFRLDGEPHTLSLTRLHLEEDSGRSVHGVVPGATALDFNRAGVALIEIVTAAGLATPEAARAFLAGLKRTLQHLGVSDCAMEQGSLRVDANVSVIAADGGAGERIEVKNLNSFSGVGRALHFEIERQRSEIASGRRVVRETRLWDAAAGVTLPLRGKEDSIDYRHLSEPDLPPLLVSPEARRRAGTALPELPLRRAARLREAHGIAAGQAEALTATRATADRFEALVGEGVSAALAGNWLLGEERAAGEEQRLADVQALARLLRSLEAGEITRHQARTRAAGSAASGGAPRPGGRTGRVTDEEVLRRWCEEVLSANPPEVERYRAGEERLLDFFIGGVMRLSGGSADPAAVRTVVRRLLERGDGVQ